MKKFNLFNKKEQIEVIEPEHKLSIPIRDLKEHMVSEFDRMRELVASNKAKDDIIEQYKEDALKHKATMVLVDEYRNRLDYQENEIRHLKQKCEEQVELRRSIEEDNNTLIIQKNIMQSKVENVDSYAEQVSKERVIEFSADLLDAVEGILSIVKGNISRARFIEILSDLIVKEEE